MNCVMTLENHYSPAVNVEIRISATIKSVVKYLPCSIDDSNSCLTEINKMQLFVNYLWHSGQNGQLWQIWFASVALLQLNLVSGA